MQKQVGDDEPSGDLHPADGEDAQVEDKDGDFEEDLHENIELSHYPVELIFC